MRVVPPPRHATSIDISPSLPAKLASASDPERYAPPTTNSFVCGGTPSPESRMRPPIPSVLGVRPRSRTATRGARPTFRYTPAGACSRLVMMSRSPSSSRSAAAIPCEISSSPANPHVSPTSPKVASPRLRKATFDSRSGGKARSRRRQSMEPVRCAASLSIAS